MGDVVQPVIAGLINAVEPIANTVFNELLNIVMQSLSGSDYFPVLIQLMNFPAYLQTNFFSQITVVMDNIIKQLFAVVDDIIVALIASVQTAIVAGENYLTLLQLQTNAVSQAVTAFDDAKKVVGTAITSLGTAYARYMQDLLLASADAAQFSAQLSNGFVTTLIGDTIKSATTYINGRITNIRKQIVRDIKITTILWTDAPKITAPAHDLNVLVQNVTDAVNPSSTISAIKARGDAVVADIGSIAISKGTEVSNLLAQFEHSADLPINQIVYFVTIFTVLGYLIYKLLSR